MKFADHLNKETIRKVNSLRKAKKNKDNVRHKVRCKEKLSQRDLEELMGIKQDIYKRVNGSWRRK